MATTMQPAAGSRLDQELQYLGAVIGLLVGRPRPAGQWGVLSHGELDRCEECRLGGWTPARFADSVRAADAARAGGAV